jgi:ankyrin repeat protein
MEATPGLRCVLFATERGHMKVVLKLLDAGADPGARDKYCETALSLALAKGHRDVVEILMPLEAETDQVAPPAPAVDAVMDFGGGMPLDLTGEERSVLPPPRADGRD